MSWKFAWASCAYPFSPTPALRRIRAHDVRFLHLQGDCPYMWNPSSGTLNLFGRSITPITKTSVAADFAAHHAMQWAEPTWAEYLAWAVSNARPTYYLPDDHAWGGDNWDHTITQANTGFNMACTTQAEVNYHWNQGMLGARQYMTENPVNTDAEAVIGDIPSQALVGDTPPASNYPINYFRVGYSAAGNVVTSNPLIEFFAVDCFSYRSPVAAVDNASKEIFGPTQTTWLKTRLPGSTATFKPILSTKKLYRNTGGGDSTDHIGFYTNRRDDLLTEFDLEGVKCAPWLVGDSHTASAVVSKKTGGAVADVLSICAAPMGTLNSSSSLSANYSNFHVWNARNGNTAINVFGLGIVEENKLTLQIRDANDAILWQCYMLPNDNTVYYPAQRFG